MKDEQGLEIIKSECIEAVKNHAPKYNQIKFEKTNDSHLLVIDIADLHIGKLASAFEVGEDYNSQIAVKRAKDGMQGILNKSQGFKIDKILFVAGNDILHTDNTRRTTTNGTPQDTDGSWFENFIMAKNLYIELLEKLQTIAEVEVVYNPSNHDLTHGFFLLQLIEAHFHNSSIRFNVDLKHRKAFKYGSNLIGTTHGDGAKTENLPLLLATEFPIFGAKQNTDTFIRTTYTTKKVKISLVVRLKLCVPLQERIVGTTKKVIQAFQKRLKATYTIKNTGKSHV
jgi:hypothetical protein